MVVSFRHLGFIGRTGNALFQFASTIGIARSMGAEPRFNENWSHRPYFSVPDEFFGVPEDAVEATDLATIIDARTRVYLQDYRLWMPVIDEVRSYLKPSPLAEEMIAGQSAEFDQLRGPILSVHVRRGDNVPGQDAGVPNKQDYYVLPTVEYYQCAIKLLRTDCRSVVVFSDEPDWCAQNLDADLFFRGVTRPKEHEPAFATAPVLDFVDLQLMARCHRHVVTGSTFGIWGALLAKSQKVVRPSPVYGPLLPYVDENTLFPSEWTRILL